MRRLDVTGSKNLTQTPDLSRATLLKELIMKGCTGLEQTPESIGGLQKLDLSHCNGLRNLPIYISEKSVLPQSGLRRRRQVIMKLPRAVKKLTSLANLSIEGEIHIKWWHLRGNAEHLSFLSEEHIPEESMVMPKERFPLSQASMISNLSASGGLATTRMVLPSVALASQVSLAWQS